MALGYSFGSLYKESVTREKRNSILLITGIGCILLFIAIRSINIYGDPQKLALQSNNLYSIFSFLSVTKYPPSLLFLLMTLGPALVLLSIDRMDNKITRILMIYGRVPLFYYLIHIYVLHLLAMLAVELTGFKWSDMIFSANWITQQPALRGYGFSLPVVYLIWVFVVIMLYPFCRRYDAYKVNNSGKWWLKYL